MAYRIIVQDGNVLYAASNPLDDLSFSVNGLLNVTKQVTVGTDSSTAGLIRTPLGSSADLIFRTDNNGLNFGNIKIEPAVGGNIILNNVLWPDGSVEPTPGMYLGVTSLNTLQYLELPVISPLYEIQVAAELQTIFNTTVPTITNSAGRTHLQVFVNGVKQIDGITKNYIITGLNQITFTSGLSLNDDVEFYAFL